MKMRIKQVLFLVVILATGSVLVLNSCKKSQAEITFETAVAGKSNLNNSVTATGTLEAIQTVAVGTQVSGVILHLYADFNTVVKKGQLLAELDKTPLMASLEESKASVANAQAELTYQEASYNRVKALYDKKLVAQTDFDQALYNYDKAKANIISVKAQFERASINLKYATICSPIDGVVLNRAVEEGQTVAASFNTPTLFSIANDLTQMEVQAAIDEADIGKVRQDQRVEFTVDAYPNEVFQGSVSQIRIEPVITSNVVTYTVIVNAPNPDKKLMPGMTATITVFTDEMQGALTIPGKALRFSPDQQLLNSYIQTLPENEKFQVSALAVAGNQTATGQVWVKNGSKIHSVSVTTGLDNGTLIEVKSGLKEGDIVVLSMGQAAGAVKNAAKQTAKSPFMPTPPGQKKKS